MGVFSTASGHAIAIFGMNWGHLTFLLHHIVEPLVYMPSWAWQGPGVNFLPPPNKTSATPSKQTPPNQESSGSFPRLSWCWDYDQDNHGGDGDGHVGRDLDGDGGVDDCIILSRLVRMVLLSDASLWISPVCLVLMARTKWDVNLIVGINTRAAGCVSWS